MTALGWRARVDGARSVRPASLDGGSSVPRRLSRLRGWYAATTLGTWRQCSSREWPCARVVNYLIPLWPLPEAARHHPGSTAPPGLPAPLYGGRGRDQGDGMLPIAGSRPIQVAQRGNYARRCETGFIAPARWRLGLELSRAGHKINAQTVDSADAGKADPTRAVPQFGRNSFPVSCRRGWRGGQAPRPSRTPVRDDAERRSAAH
jgi:hypothetical protein